jgi:hypothetical protein
MHSSIMLRFAATQASSVPCVPHGIAAHAVAISPGDMFARAARLRVAHWSISPANARRHEALAEVPQSWRVHRSRA